MSVAATGGYGRGTLAPFSDIDLLFLTPHHPSAHTFAVVEFMLYFLWDLGLKVGHATRSIEDCLTEGAKDVTIRTSLLDARHLAGDAALFDSFPPARSAPPARKRAPPSTSPPSRPSARRATAASATAPSWSSRTSRKAAAGCATCRRSTGSRDTSSKPYTMGELADVAGVLSPVEARHARRSWEFLWTLRFHLHYVAGRAEERLTFDLQPVVGARMGYTRHGRQDGVERFMRHYFLTARDIARLTRVLEPAILRAALGPPAIAAETDKALIAAGFVLAEGDLLPVPGRDFGAEPIQMLRILKVARDRDLALHPLAIRSLIRNERAAARLRGDPQAAALFMDLLCGRPPDHGLAHVRESRHPDGARWLGILNETGFLGRYLPDWSRIVGQMQFDTYHVFTVDEHTIEAIRVLNTLERGELAESRRSPPAWSITSSPAARSIWRCCCTTSPRGAAATIPASAPRSRSRSGPPSGCQPRKPKRSPGSCCTT